jgi:hypothetical protein
MLAYISAASAVLAHSIEACADLSSCSLCWHAVLQLQLCWHAVLQSCSLAKLSYFNLCWHNAKLCVLAYSSWGFCCAGMPQPEGPSPAACVGMQLCRMC